MEEGDKLVLLDMGDKVIRVQCQTCTLEYHYEEGDLRCELQKSEKKERQFFHLYLQCKNQECDNKVCVSTCKPVLGKNFKYDLKREFIEEKTTKPWCRDIIRKYILNFYGELVNLEIICRCCEENNETENVKVPEFLIEEDTRRASSTYSTLAIKSVTCPLCQRVNRLEEINGRALCECVLL
jgi:hypothetical protein